MGGVMDVRVSVLIACLLFAPGAAIAEGPLVSIFDGKTFNGWTGDTKKTWRVVDGAIVGGSLRFSVPQNEFLKTEQRYADFELRLKFKLTGSKGFINAGIQIRSEIATSPPNEMIGYQADIGDEWWGVLYDETRRNVALAKPDPAASAKAVRRGDWNEYVIRCEGNRIRTWINGVAMIDYTEADDAIPQVGRIGLQVHGGGKALVSYRDITVKGLP
jgi:hypothetical protein